MGKIKVELNHREIEKLLTSSEVTSFCQSEAEKIAARCGTGYATDTHVVSGTLRNGFHSAKVLASVYTTTKEAYRNEQENKTLLKALGG